jgi:hypothetical protein
MSMSVKIASIVWIRADVIGDRTANRRTDKNYHEDSKKGENAQGPLGIQKGPPALPSRGLGPKLE